MKNMFFPRFAFAVSHLSDLIRVENKILIGILAKRVYN